MSKEKRETFSWAMKDIAEKHPTKGLNRVWDTAKQEAYREVLENVDKMWADEHDNDKADELLREIIEWLESLQGEEG